METDLGQQLGFVLVAVVSFEEDGVGNGRHIWNIGEVNTIRYIKVCGTMKLFIIQSCFISLTVPLQLTLVSNILYAVVIFLTKLSILFLYLRMFRFDRVVFLGVHLLIWVTFLFYFGSVFIQLFQCSPREKIWLPETSGTCIDQAAWTLVFAVFNTATNTLILLLPIYALGCMKADWKKRLLIFAVFIIGLLYVPS